MLLGLAGGGKKKAVAATPPILTSATVGSAGTTIALLFNVPTSPILPASAATGFTVSVNGSGATISSNASNGSDTITLTMSATIFSGDTVTVAYTPGNVTDSAPTSLAAFGATSATNNSTITHGSQRFATPSVSGSFVVPTGITSITAELWGAGGGGEAGIYPDTQFPGGAGGYVKGTLTVTPGETLTVITGAGGGFWTGAVANAIGGGGKGGGGGSHKGGGGGGRSAIRRSTTELMTAGGGGGGGLSYLNSTHLRPGGVGGGTTGGGPGYDLANGGPGTPSAGGAGGTGGSPGGAGTQYTGGDANQSAGGTGAAGGGGGYYGGGGGGDTNAGSDLGAGGGGSSYTGSATSITNTSGSGTTSGGAASPNYTAGVGAGGSAGTSVTATAGGRGDVYITW